LANFLQIDVWFDILIDHFLLYPFVTTKSHNIFWFAYFTLNINIINTVWSEWVLFFQSLQHFHKSCLVSILHTSRTLLKGHKFSSHSWHLILSAQQLFKALFYWRLYDVEDLCFCLSQQY
jgi:hypothetical protein